MNFDWHNIILAIPLIVLIVYLAPRALQMVRHSPKGSNQDWLQVALLLTVVALFVFILMKFV